MIARREQAIQDFINNYDRSLDELNQKYDHMKNADTNKIESTKMSSVRFPKNHFSGIVDWEHSNNL